MVWFTLGLLSLRRHADDITGSALSFGFLLCGFWFWLIFALEIGPKVSHILASAIPLN